MTNPFDVSCAADSSRRRRGQKRSHSGCQICKLRKVKCDEKTPQCGNCQKAHIVCNYTSSAVYMRSSHELTMDYAPVLAPQFSDNELILGMINRSLSSHHSSNSAMGRAFQLKLPDLQRLFRFQNRTVLSFGPLNVMNVYKTEAIRLVALHPYLLHIVMTYTAMHDRYLAGQSHMVRTSLECFHWAMASKLFNQELSRSSQPHDWDAIWMAAVYMSWTVLYAVETQDPQEVWPLSSATNSDIPWLPAQRGLRIMWPMARPDRPESILRSTVIDAKERCMGLPLTKPGIDGIRKDMVDMCELNEASNAANNPYHTAVRILSDLIDDAGAHSNSLNFLAFINTIEHRFETLLKQRDPRSLSLMAIWYGLIPKSAWWFSLRASLERTAILTYLNRYHPGTPLIQTILASLQTTTQSHNIITAR